jgi:deoxyribose-phosphate aldolase
MYIEYAIYDTAVNETEFKSSLTEIIKYHPDSISVLPAYLKPAKGLLGDQSNIKLSCPIDYPMGLMDLKSRITATEQAIKGGVKIIDIVCPSIILSNRKYDRFREDVKTMHDLCSLSNIQLRYFLEYRIYSYELLYKIVSILYESGITTIFPSTGHFLDDIYDNILASALINKKVPSINIICNGNAWNSQHYTAIKKANLYGTRTCSLNGLKLLKDQNI